jgi:hypothetical protein
MTSGGELELTLEATFESPVGATPAGPKAAGDRRRFYVVWGGLLLPDGRIGSRI